MGISQRDVRKQERTQSEEVVNIAAMAVGFFTWYTCSNWVSALSYGFSFEHWWLNRSGAVIVVTVVLCFFLWCFGKTMTHCRTLDWLSAALYAVAIFALFSLRNGDNIVLEIIFLLTFAIAQTWMVVRWSQRYCASATQDVTKSLLFAIVLVAVVKSITTFLPESATMMLMLFLPFLSAGMLVFHQDKGEGKDRPDVWFTVKSFLPFVRIIVAMSVFFFLWSILNMTLKYGTGHYSFGTEATPAYTLVSQGILLLFCLVVYVWIFVRHRRLDLTAIWQFSYVLMAFALFMLVAVGLDQLIQAFTGAAIVLAQMFLWLALANVSRHSAFKPFMVFCLGMLLYSVPDYLGRSAVSFLLVDALEPVFVTAIMVIIVVMVAFFLPARSPDVQQLLAELNGVPISASPQAGNLDDRCVTLGMANSLSKREVEILRYLCKGRSRPYIAETLYLSENTVRTHSKSIYAKLGIHNRQELLDLVSG